MRPVHFRAARCGGSARLGAASPSGRALGPLRPSVTRDVERDVVARNVNGAIALLRSALAQAPGDPEIAEVLGRLAFRDREPGGR